MKRLLLAFLLLGVSLFVGCGGSSGSSSTPPPTVTLTAIAVTPASPSINVGATQQFTATGTYSDGTTKNLTATANWISVTSSVATINTSGLATAVAAGTSSITATSGAVVGSTTLTVANPLVSIAVTPPTVTLAPVAQQQFTATGKYADGTTQNITSTVTWASSAPTVAAINPAGLAVAVAPGTTTISATLGTISGTATLTVAVTNPLVSISVTPTTASVPPTGTQQFTATGTYADHSTHNITSTVTWNASVGATITSGGLATGVTPNTTSTIMAAQGTISGTAILTITNPLVSIAVTPSAPSIAPGTTQQFIATGTYADHSTSVITSSVTWASSNLTVATISNAQGTQGLASGLTPGTALITATSGSVTSPPATLTVTSATLVSIAVTPATPAIVLQTRQQFTATGTFSDSSTQNITDTVTWSSSDRTKILINSGVGGGLAYGVATTSSPVTIQAAQSGIKGSTTATVIPPMVVSIAITPTTTTLAMGTSRRYRATATLTNGGTLNVTSLATWTSSNPSIATVSAGLVNAQIVTSSTPVTITATYNGVSQSLDLTVTFVTVSSITVTPISATIPAGVEQQFFATATFSDQSTQDVSANATWNSTNTAVATVNLVGVATAVSSGPATISAAFGGQTGSAQLTVDAATLSSITVTGPSVLAPGSTANYQALGHYSDQTTQFITGLVTWASTNSSVVSITTGGIANGLSAGSANITAAYQGVTSNFFGVIVTSSPLVSIALTPSTATTYEGVSLQFAATGTFMNGQTQTLTNNVTWASSQPSIATISNVVGQQGFATGVAPGQTSITALFANVVSAPATLTVSNATLVSIAVTPISPIVQHGAQQQFTATGTFSDSSVVVLTFQATWTSSVATVATINDSGLASTVSPGTTVITATFVQNGLTVTGTTNLTVQ